MPDEKTLVDMILDDLIQANPKKFEQAKHDTALISWFTREATQIAGRRTTPMAFSQAMRRRLSEEDNEYNERDNQV